MGQFYRQVVLLIVTMLPLTSIFASKIFKTAETYYLGETPIQIVQYKSPHWGLTYFHPHQDETTSLMAAQMMVAAHGGEVITLVHPGGGRLITFRLKGRAYTIDPNRIFTPHGVKKTLQLYGADSLGARRVVRHFGIHLLYLLPSSFIIAVHNNHATGFSIRSYCPGGMYDSDVRRMKTFRAQRSHDLVVVTDKLLYEIMQWHHFNVVWEDVAKDQDDGSLSYFAIHHDIPYMNVDTERGHLKAQLRILSSVQCFIPSQK